MAQSADSDYIRIGKLAVQRGLLTREQLETSIHELSQIAYARMRQGQENVPELGEFLVGKSLLTPEVLRDLQREQERMIVEPVSKKFGPYTLLREIGRGGMSVVWEAFDNELRRRVAVKFLTTVRSQPSAPPMAEEDETLRRFYREAQTAARLKHPNIVDIFEVNVREGMHYIAMEYVDGLTLNEAVAAQKLDRRASVTVLRDSARAVQFAHEAGVIHRDVKPQNIMVDTTGRAVVMDFGLARNVQESERLTLSGVAIGTPSYMSPEHAQGSKGQLDPRSDVYSLGAILFELLTGRPPFLGENAMQIMLATVQEEPPAPRKLDPTAPPELEAVCLRAIEKEMDRRYSTAGEFAAELDRWIQGARVQTRGPSRTARWVRRVGLHRGLAAVLFVTIAACLAVLALAVSRRGDRARRAEAHRAWAAVHEARGDWDRAESEYSKAIAIDAGDAVARSGRERCARAKEEAGVRAERERRCRERFEAGLRAFDRGEWFAAVDEFDAAIRESAGFPWVHYYRGLAHEQAKWTEEAVRDLQRAFGGEPENPLFRRELARLRRALEETERAARIAKAKEAHLAGRRTRGPEEAIGHFTRALDLWPEFAECLVDRAEAYLKTGDPVRAASDASAALRMAPEFARAHLAKARALRAQRRYDPAEIHYHRAAELDADLRRVAERELAEMAKERV